MDWAVGIDVHMWFVLILTALAVGFFIWEKFPLEVTSIGLLTVLLLFGQLFPLENELGKNLLNADALLAGYANPSLIAVLALLVMGQAMIHTDSLRSLTGVFSTKTKVAAWVSMLTIFVLVMTVSAFMNNTPLVIIAIPLLQAIAHSIGMSQSRIMIPLSYVAILGGMTTLIGSSTNLLVGSAMTELGYTPLRFFDFVVPGVILAAVGFVYVVFILPRFLSDRSSMARDLAGDEKEFVAELDINPDSKLIGMECVEGSFPDLSDLRVKLIQRGGHLILPPFEGYKIESGDIMIVAATRESLGALLSKYPGYLLSEEEAEAIEKHEQKGEEEGGANVGNEETRLLAELMITPASRMIDMSLEHANFHRQFGTIVLGIQRRARVVRRRLGRIRLEPGDVLLVAGSKTSVDSLRDSNDFIVLSGSKRELPIPAKAPLAIGVFLTTITLAALGIISIPVGAIAGSVIMIATGCLNIRQATRAIDRKIFLLVGAMLALGTAMQVTGGAQFLANSILSLPFVDTPFAMIAVLFLLIAFTTNVLSNNACAILFTPIALSLAGSFSPPDVLDPEMIYLFAITVIFAANCSFASPIGYQTNLLVMGPGHYRFRDFIKAGVPLIFIIWGTFLLLLKFLYGL